MALNCSKEKAFKVSLVTGRQLTTKSQCESISLRSEGLYSLSKLSEETGVLLVANTSILKALPNLATSCPIPPYPATPKTISVNSATEVICFHSLFFWSSICASISFTFRRIWAKTYVPMVIAWTPPPCEKRSGILINS